MDRIKIVIAALLVVAGIAAYYYFANLPDIVRYGMVIAGIIAGAIVGATSGPGRELRGFTKESVEETKKVVWPTRKESFQTTGIVFAFVIVMAVFLWLTDKTLEWTMYDLILGWKR